MRQGRAPVTGFWLLAVVLMLSSSSNRVTAQDALFRRLLDDHNQRRALHGAAPLTWDPDLESDAAAFVARCSFAHDVQELRTSFQGENLITTGPPDVELAIKSAIYFWYKEVDLYDYSNPGFSTETGHFTQMVWLATSRIGCAATYCDRLADAKAFRSGMLLSCRYKSPGNVMGRFEQNVLPAGTPPVARPLPAPADPAPAPADPAPAPEVHVSVPPEVDVPAFPPRSDMPRRPTAPTQTPTEDVRIIRWLQGDFISVREDSVAVLAYRVGSNGTSVCRTATTKIVRRVSVDASPLACPARYNGDRMNPRSSMAHWGLQGEPPTPGRELCDPTTLVTLFIFSTSTGSVQRSAEGCYEATVYMFDGTTRRFLLKYY